MPARIRNPHTTRTALRQHLDKLLATDGWQLNSPGRDDPAAMAPACWIAAKESRRIAFFLSTQPARVVQTALAAIASADAGRFQWFGVLIVPDAAALHGVRSPRLADKYPRAFFAAADQLADWAARKPLPPPASPGNIAAFQAELLANDQIGGAESPYYILRFRAPAIEDVTPSQFVMMDVTDHRPLLEKRAVRARGWEQAVDCPPLPILKRPFGIQRAYYPHFDKLYLQNLHLPPTLAPALHTVYPHQFDLLYKVIPDGVGTALMTRLKPGAHVHMLGPLGRPYDVRHLRAEGVEEVHVIGGGVGMAPLILLVQVLRYFSFPVKVFIGISTLDILRYRGDVDASFAEEPGNAYVYVDDLLEAGLAPADIHLAFDTAAPAQTVRGIPAQNLARGFVTDQYRAFLDRTTRRSTRAFTCGPDRMMELVYDITRAAGIPLQVLMEKRMGCGFGVCLSCVCQVRRADGSEDYARVCTEGPVFDADQIIWKPNHNSKSASAACGSARPC